MTWLLVQIGLCLLLAALAGWFLGWSMRGFRETDQVEDLRQTLSATVDVKDRELSESYRQVESLRSRSDVLERTNRSLEAKLGEKTSKPPAPEAPPRSMLVPPVPRPVPETISERSQGGAAVEVLEDARQRRDARNDLASERRLRATAETELREKASTLLSLRSEIESLRDAVDERAARIVKLESRMIELEPLEEKLRRSEARVEKLQVAAVPAPPLVQETTSGALQEQLNAREILINELRARVNDLHAELDTARREHRRADRVLTDSASTARLQHEQDESARQLQRQIERNRKQETVHRSVVENLHSELETLRGEARDALSIRKELESRRSTGSDNSNRWREALAERESQIIAYRRRLANLEDLKLIAGIGPAFERRLSKNGVTHFAQIAQWTPDDIERIAKALGTNVKRIVRGNWLESARKLR